MEHGHERATPMEQRHAKRLPCPRARGGQQGADASETSAKPRRHCGAREGDAGNVHLAANASVRRRPEEAAKKKNRDTSGWNQPDPPSIVCIREMERIRRNWKHKSISWNQGRRRETIHVREWRW
jgi:hypothetical protein